MSDDALPQGSERDGNELFNNAVILSVPVDDAWSDCEIQQQGPAEDGGDRVMLTGAGSSQPPTEELPPARELDELEQLKQELDQQLEQRRAEPADDGTSPPPLGTRDLEELERELDQRLEQRRQEFADDGSSLPQSFTRGFEDLQQRVDELETARTAQEDATRAIIDQTISRRGSYINDVVIFGGTLETLSGWAEDFDGSTESFVRLNTAEFDFEIDVNEWLLGSIILEYLDGFDVLFPTNRFGDFAVDRVNVDTALVTLGNTQKLWPFATFGRVIVPFGISTGDPVADVLTIEDPLTLEVFETKEDVIWIGFEYPTPPPPPPPTSNPVRRLPPPKVKPILFRPLLNGFARHLCYRPPPPPPPPEPQLVPYTPVPPPFTGGIYVFNGDTFDGGDDHVEHFGATLGYRTQGYSAYQLPIIFPCPGTPWKFDVDVDFVSSVFDSQFFEFEYRPFLDQIGYVPGMAAHFKTTLGPVGFVAEWNGAISGATLTDDLDNVVNIMPGAWQVSFAYQFDWNPSVTVNGLQGTYVTMGYSQSYDLAGITQVIDGEPTRIGFVPEKRFLVGIGEWIFDTTRVAFEYARVMDYSQADGGTGNSANGFFGMLTYEW